MDSITLNPSVGGANWLVQGERTKQAETSQWETPTGQAEREPIRICRDVFTPAIDNPTPTPSRQELGDLMGTGRYLGQPSPKLELPPDLGGPNLPGRTPITVPIGGPYTGPVKLEVPDGSLPGLPTNLGPLPGITGPYTGPVKPF